MLLFEIFSCVIVVAPIRLVSQNNHTYEIVGASTYTPINQLKQLIFKEHDIPVANQILYYIANNKIVVISISSKQTQHLTISQLACYQNSGTVLNLIIANNVQNVLNQIQSVNTSNEKLAKTLSIQEGKTGVEIQAEIDGILLNKQWAREKDIMPVFIDKINYSKDWRKETIETSVVFVNPTVAFYNEMIKFASWKENVIMNYVFMARNRLNGIKISPEKSCHTQQIDDETRIFAIENRPMMLDIKCAYLTNSGNGNGNGNGNNKNNNMLFGGTNYDKSMNINVTSTNTIGEIKDAFLWQLERNYKNHNLNSKDLLKKQLTKKDLNLYRCYYNSYDPNFIGTQLMNNTIYDGSEPFRDTSQLCNELKSMYFGNSDIWVMIPNFEFSINVIDKSNGKEYKIDIDSKDDCYQLYEKAQKVLSKDSKFVLVTKDGLLIKRFATQSVESINLLDVGTIYAS